MSRPNKIRYRADRDTWVTKVRGQLHTLAHGRKGKKAAEAAFYELMTKLGKNQPTGKSIAVAVLFDHFMDHAARELAPLTAETYRRHLASALVVIGAMPAEDVRPWHVTQWLDSQAGWGPSTRSGAITAVKRAYAWGEEQGMLGANPLAKMKKPPVAVRSAILSPDQVAQIMAAVEDEEFRDLLTVCHGTGMRPSEAMRLEASMLDSAAGTITQRSKTTRKTGRLRVISLNDQALEVLARLAARYPSGPLLRNQRGNAWTRNATCKRFLALRDKLGFGKECVLESFRHRFVTDALKRGENTAIVAALAGHVDTTMVARVYSKLHQDAEHLQDVVRRVRPGDEPAKS